MTHLGFFALSLMLSTFIALVLPAFGIPGGWPIFFGVLIALYAIDFLETLLRKCCK